jgi:hypothetical protein
MGIARMRRIAFA